MIPDRVRAGIFAGESGGDYNALFGYSNRKGPFAGVNVTDMTVNDVIRFTDPSGPYAQWVKGQVGHVATPVGAYQVVGTTLRAAARGLGLTGNERFDQATQDAIGNWIYQTQGTGAWEGYRGPQDGGSAAPMGLLSMSTSGGMPQPQQQAPMTFRDRLRQSWQSGDMLDNVTLALNSMRMQPDQNLAQMVGMRQERRQQAEMSNRTAAWLEANGRPDLAEAVRGGVIDGASAFTVMNQKPEERGQVVSDAQLKEMFPGAQVEPGLYNLKSDGTITKVGGGGTTINMPPQIGTIPPGYTVEYDQAGRPTGMRPIPGSPAEQEAAAATEKGAMADEQAAQGADVVLTAIGDVKAKVTDGGLPTTGFIGGLLSNVGGTDAGDIASSLETITGAIAIDRLMAMKAASPTGGALGAVTAPELEMLKASLGALQQKQSEEQFLTNLKRVEEQYLRIRAKAPAAFGDAAPAAGGTLSPEAQRYLEGN